MATPAGAWQKRTGGPVIIAICSGFVSSFVCIAETKYLCQCLKTLLISAIEDITMAMYCSYNIIHCFLFINLSMEIIKNLDFISVICYTENCSCITALK
jgi:hypothetical protein